MYTQAPPPGESGSNTVRLAGSESNTEILAMQQERRYMSVHRDGANAATKHMTQHAHSEIVRKAESRNNKKQHAVGCECMHMEAIGGQLTV